jgi:hypothetical protein
MQRFMLGPLQNLVEHDSWGLSDVRIGHCTFYWNSTQILTHYFAGSLHATAGLFDGPIVTTDFVSKIEGSSP